MAVKKSRRAHRKKNSAGETASEARLTPPEERVDNTGPHPAPRNDGTLVLNTGRLKLPQEAEEEPTRFLYVDPAVLVILCVSLIFIAVIAYIIWNGWEPPR